MKKKKYGVRKILKLIAGVILFLAAAVLIVVFLFRTRAFDVEGNSYYSDNTVSSWIQNDRLSVNTLYVLAKYNLTEPDLPSGVDEMKVSLKNPWTLHVTVKEKDLAGYLDYDGAYLYFDRDGTAALRTKKVIEGVPYVIGLEFDSDSVTIGERLPVEDADVFDQIVEASLGLEKYGLTPDSVSCADGNIQVYFGSVEVLLGSGGYDEKLEQAAAILQKLAELYPDTAGTLHLENYDSDTDAIRFVPSGS